MKEDLNAIGNELNYYEVACKTPQRRFEETIVDRPIDNTAYVIGQIPLMTLQTKARM